jgi:hypothetical protein
VLCSSQDHLGTGTCNLDPSVLVGAKKTDRTAPGFRVGPKLEFELDLNFPYLEISLLGGLEAM